MTDSTIKKPEKNHEFLVFTSAGDQNNINGWCEGKRNFDLWVYYYGEKENPPGKKHTDFFNRSKGGKMQNFYKCLNDFRDVIEKYNAILLADDDIVINSENINILFKQLELNELVALQPAADPAGKASYPLHNVKIGSELRFVNFLEITFPFFKTQPLLEFMKEYSPIVNCWGVDWWFSYFLTQRYGQRSLAIIDTIPYFNPYDFDKTDGREIEKLSSIKELAATWEKFQKDNNIITEKGNLIVYNNTKSKKPLVIFKQVYIYLRYQVIRIFRHIKRLIK